MALATVIQSEYVSMVGDDLPPVIFSKIRSDYQNQIWVDSYLKYLNQWVRVNEYTVVCDIYFLTATNIDIKIRLAFIKSLLNSRQWKDYKNKTLEWIFRSFIQHCQEIEILRALLSEIRFRKFVLASMNQKGFVMETITKYLDSLHPWWREVSPNSLQYWTLIQILTQL